MSPEKHSAKSFHSLAAKIASVSVAAFTLSALTILTNTVLVGATATPNASLLGRIAPSPSVGLNDVIVARDPVASSPLLNAKHSSLSWVSSRFHRSYSNREHYSSSPKEPTNSHSLFNISASRRHQEAAPLDSTFRSPIFPQRDNRSLEVSSQRSRVKDSHANQQPLSQYDQISPRDSSKSYSIVDSFEGHNFFDGWDFFDYSDPTHGMITYVSAQEAYDSRLAYVQDDGTVIMTVDTVSSISPGGHRKSVRITSKQSYGQGLFIFDITRAPHGCSVWPAAWLVGPSWPMGGEIDIIEGVHENGFNQMTVHSAAGCILDATKSIPSVFPLTGTSDPFTFTGTVLGVDCNAALNFNAGCGVLDFDPRSYGAGLNQNGGGIYATLWDDSGVRIWFFNRGVVPENINNKSPDPETWGSPKAFWAADACPSSFFSNLSIVFDIVLGGDWAGTTFTEAGCPGSLADYVANPANFADAHWAVNSVRVYQQT